MEYAYARVSTKGQNLDRQIIDLVKEGIKVTKDRGIKIGRKLIV